MQKVFLKSSLFYCFSLICLFSAAQEKIYKANNIVYASIAGEGGMYSINYERVVYRSPNDVFGTSLGLGYSSWKNEPWLLKVSYLIPARLNFWIGKNNSYFDFGVTMLSGKTADKNFRGHWLESKFSGVWFPHLGYRLQKPVGGFFFKADFIPLWNPEHQIFDSLGISGSSYRYRKIPIFPWFGLSVGYTFKVKGRI